MQGSPSQLAGVLQFLDRNMTKQGIDLNDVNSSHSSPSFKCQIAQVVIFAQLLGILQISQRTSWSARQAANMTSVQSVNIENTKKH